MNRGLTVCFPPPVRLIAGPRNSFRQPKPPSRKHGPRFHSPFFQRQSARPEARQAMQILLLEHHLPLARAVMRGLEEEGIAAHLARDDAEGDARVRSIAYAALLVDWRVPRRGGAALVRSWRQEG